MSDFLNSKKYVIKTLLYCKDVYGEYHMDSKSDAEFVYETDDVTDVPTLDKLKKVALAHDCQDDILAITTITKDGSYVDSSEIEVTIDRSANVIYTINIRKRFRLSPTKNLAPGDDMAGITGDNGDEYTYIFKAEYFMYYMYMSIIYDAFNWVVVKIRFLEFIRRKPYTDDEKFYMLYKSIRFRAPFVLWNDDFKRFIEYMKPGIIPNL